MDCKDIRKAAAALVQAIYDEPDIPEHPVLLAGLSDTKRMAFKNGYYSVRDLQEFRRLLSLLKESGDYPKTFIEMMQGQ